MNKKLPLVIIVVLVAMLLLSLTGCFGNEITISFDTNGGNATASIGIALTATELVLPTPTKDGHNFEYWCYDAGCTQRVDTSVIPTEDTTFYAKWAVKLVTLTFISTDPITNEVTRQYHYVSYGTGLDVADMPHIKEVEGYQSVWLSENLISVTEPQTIYARYSKKVYYVKYFVDGEEYRSYQGIDNSAIDVPESPTKENFYFMGWYFDVENTQRSKTPITQIPAQSLNLYAKFVDISDNDNYYNYTTVGGNVKIVGLTPMGKLQSELIIPRTINNNAVTSIGYANDNTGALSLSVFRSETLQRVVIPDSVELIGSFAFYGATALKEVVFEGNSLLSLGTGAFANCTSLTEIDLPNSVTSIGKYCFAGMAITDSDSNNIVFNNEGSWSTLNKWAKTAMDFAAINFTQNSALATISNYAFFNLQNFSSITLPKNLSQVNYCAFIDSGLSTITAFAGGNFVAYNNTVYSSDGKTLVYYPLNGGAELVLRESTLTIAAYAFFDNQNISSVTANSALSSIGQYAFYNCGNLSSVDLSTATSFTAIASYAFAQSAVTDFVVPSTLTSLGKGAFEDAASLTNFSFGGSSLGVISQDTFKGCHSLISIIIPTSVVTIGKNAFYNCTALSSLEFGENSVLKTIEDYAFANCTNISIIALPSGLENIYSYAFAGEYSRMNLYFSIVPAGLKTLGDYAFQNTKVSNFSINITLQSLGKGVFKNCTSLGRISIANSPYITAIPQELLYGCSALTQISFPNSILHIGDRAFFNCSSLATVYFDFTPQDTGIASIGESAFEGCVLLEGGDSNFRVLPKTLIAIEKRAFYGCQALAKIYIPANLEYLSAETFAHCGSLTEINYDAGGKLKTIGENAFAYCTSLATARLPHTLLERDDLDTTGAVKNPFVGCTNLLSFTLTNNSYSYTVVGGVLYKTIDNGKQIYLYPAGKDAPFEISGDITAIDRYAFFGTAVSSLSFAYNASVGGVETIALVNIGAYAFSSSNLKTATISKRVYHIEENAFSHTKLNQLSIENTVVNNSLPSYNIINSDVTSNTLTISEDAFQKTSITYLQIPERLAEIKSGAFSENYLLQQLVFNDSTTFPLTIGSHAFFGNNTLTSIVLPQQLSLLGDYAFANCFNMQSVSFSYLAALSIELIIGDYAFSNNHYLYTANLPQHLFTLGEGAFSNNTRLAEINFATIINSEDLVIPPLAFFGCNNLKNLVLPSYISEIGEKAFYKTKLETITLSGVSLLTIGKYAFAEIATLKTIDFPSNAIIIGEYAFYNTALEEFTYAVLGGDITILSHAFEKTNLTNISLGSRFVSMGSYAFANTNALTVAEIWDGIDTIGAHAFENSKITTITLDFAVTSIGDYAFANTAYLSSISGAFVSIGEYAFYRSAIALFALSQAVNSLTVGSSAFRSCNNLVSIDFSNMTIASISIGDFAFADSDKLSTLKINGAFNAIGIGIAYNATSLDKLELVDTIPNNYYCDESGALYQTAADKVILLQYPAGYSEASYSLPNNTLEIGDYAFYGNKYILSVILLGSTMLDKGVNTFAGTNDKLRIYVAENLVDTYLTQWNTTNISFITTQLDGFVLKYLGNDNYSIIDYAGSQSNITISGAMSILEEGKIKTFRITQIEGYAFANNATLQSVIIGNGIRIIYEYAFANCINLQSVVIGDNIQTIKNYAFADCIALNSVTFGSNLESIGNSAFRNCSNLDNVNLPNTLLTIGDYAFSKATALQNIDLGNSLQSLGSNAFEYNSSLVSLTLPPSLRTINQNVFFNSEKLTFLYLLSPQAPTLKLNAFRNTSESLFFFVNESSKNQYKGDSAWRVYSSRILSIANISQELDYQNYVIEHISGNNYRLIAYLGSEENITIVSGISENVKITEIGSYAISHFTKVITLNEGIITLKEYSFAHATALQQITLPSSLTTIGAYSFASLSTLQTVNFANLETSKLSTVANYAFYNTTNMASFVFPKSLVSVGNYAFAKTTENLLSSIVFNSAATNSIIIGSSAFSGNTLLKNITFECVVATIGESAFANCVNLEAIYFNSKSGTITSLSGTTKVFENCNKLSVFVTTTTVLTGFSESWKHNNSYLNKLSLSTLIAHDTLDIIGQDGFVIRTIVGSSNTASIINYLGSDTIVTFPSQITVASGTYNITKIGRGDNAYVIGSNVTKVIIPASVTEISPGAFHNSAALETVEFSANSVLTTIGKNAFSDSKKLKNINIPKTIVVIDEYAFAGCSLLSNITFGNLPAYDSAALDIRQYAFADCTSLITIALPLHTVAIGSRVFNGAINLQNVIIDVQCKLATLGGYAFNNTAITSIYLPVTVTSVANYCFTNCPDLRAIYLNREISGTSSLTIAGANIFDATSSAFIKIYVPLTSYTNYVGSTGWETKTVIPHQKSGDFNYTVNPTGNNTVTITNYLGDSTTLNIPSSILVNGIEHNVTALGKYVGNEHIKAVVFSANNFVTSLGRNAFAECTSLEKIHLPNGITTIEQYAFYGCSALKDIKLPNQLNTVQDFTFANCTALNEITIPQSVVSLGNSAFMGCTALNRLIINFTDVSALGSFALQQTPATLKIVVGDQYLNSFAANWVSQADKLVGRTLLVGDFILQQNDTGYALIQYNGKSDIDLTDITFFGEKITEIRANSIIDQNIMITIYDTVTYYEAIASQIVIKDSD